MDETDDVMDIMSTLEGREINTFSFLIMGLFLVAIVTGVTYIGLDYLKSTVCTQAQSGFVWENGVCYNESGGTAQEITAITKISIVEISLDLALGLLALVVLMLIFKKVIKIAKSFD